MKKLGLLLCATSALILAACSASAAQVANLPERNARIIVEVDRDIDSLSEAGAKKTQLAVYNNIKAAATANIRMVDQYTVLNNAFVLEVNSNDVESIKAVPGVKSVTVDELHWEQVINNDEYVTLNTDEEIDPDLLFGSNDNVSAETMKLPEDSNLGEGTLVAILDNEFHFRGRTGNSEDDNNGEAWNHEVFGALDNDVAVRYTYDSIGSVISSASLKAGKRASGKVAGDEGSLYFNNKVPFYFDYGGDSKIYGKRGALDPDVHSDISYHGSHVASITAANAPKYKGIAPKAQLALMKVFTDYNAKGLGEKLGLSNRTGAYDTSILDALEDCIKLKVDGINMSLGSDLDDFDAESITLKTLTRLNKEGILTSISAGNAGKSSYSSTGAYSNWMPESVETGILGSYANNEASMIIASGHPTKIFYENAFRMDNQNIAFEDQIVNRTGFDDEYDKEFRIKQIYHDQPLEWVYVPGFGTAADYKGLNVAGKIAVVNRGSTSFANKYEVAVDKEAIALVIINNDPTASSFNFRCSFGDGFNPTIPCALVLFKDKGFFESKGQGSFDLIYKQVNDNPAKFTVSDFSTDGAAYSLDLKPDITAPGDIIRGAVPEHAMTNLTKSERESELYKYKCYQYLSGTSMSAPNYAGAQSIVLSKKAAGIYQAAKAENRALTPEETAAIDAYRATVNMRLMSTADPMHDYTANPEDEGEVKSVTSPRMQGAGMVDLTGALSTDVYLEGKTFTGEPSGKSKVTLRNNEDIAKGDIKLSFLAHNESEEARAYDVELTVMRPAIAHPNDIVTKEYNYKGTVESIESFNGMKYYDKDLDKMMTATGSVAYKDAVKADKDIEYYASKEDFQADKKTVIAKGYYYNAANEGVSWEPLPSYKAQSTKDVEIAKIVGQTVTIPAGDSTVTINPYSLTKEQKDAILEVYEYGCMIEGYVTLKSKDNHADLSIPYLGFYSGTDRNPDANYKTVPVAEPFNFEKDPTKVYPSDLVNDIAKSLIGKDRANMESMIVAGYAENPQSVDTEKVLENDLAFDGMTGFYKVGTDPLTNEYVENAKDNIYVGGQNTNTMIIQQFMLRSVKENFFTITNKATGKVVCRSVLEDMLFGDTGDHWTLYKSHVDGGYLSGGYVAHRACAVVPLFDEASGEKFESGDYEIEFNYQLAYDGSWVKKAYDMHIDSDAPVVGSISQYRKDGVERVRIYLEDTKLAYGIIGYNRVDIQYDATAKKYYIDETKQFIDDCMNEISEGLETKRLYIGVVDFARTKTGAIVHMNDERSFAAGYQIVQSTGLEAYHDFSVANNKVSFINTLTGMNADVKGDLKYSKFAATGQPIYDEPEETTPAEEVEIPDSSAPASSEPASSNPAESSSSEPAAPAKKGCNGALASMSIIVGLPALMGAAVLFLKKRKEGGKQCMKTKFKLTLLISSLIALGTITACDPSGKTSNNPGSESTSAGQTTGSDTQPGSDSSTSATDPFSFTAELSGGVKSLNKGQQANIEISEFNKPDGATTNYSYSSSDANIAAVNGSGVVTAVAKGKAKITIKEASFKLQKVVEVEITDATIANGGFNYASLAGEAAVNQRTEILGKLEKYAMDNHLTGITLFENGGFVKYHERVTLPTTEYITGYGFGLLSEGTLDKDLDTEENAKYKRYLHSATSSDPKNINARNDTGSQVSDLEGYITSSFWGTKMNSKKTQYEWYPVLAKDTIKVNGVDQAFSRPVPVFNGEEILPGQPEKNPLGLYKTWRIYVKTGANSGLKYRYNGNAWGGKNFDQRDVALEDYEFAYYNLLTASHGLKRGPQIAADQTYGIVGALSYNNRTKKTSDAQSQELWENMKAEGRLGIKTDTDPVNGEYIELTILNAIDRFTAMYTLSSSLYSPLPKEFIQTIGDGSIQAGSPIYGTFNNNDGAPSGHKDKMLDYVLSVGPYMLEDWDKGQTIIFKKNDLWNEPNRYYIQGIKLIVIDTSSDADAIYKQFNAGKLDSTGIPTKHIAEEMGQPRVYKTRGDSTFKLNVNSCTQETWDELFGPNGKINKGSTWDVKPWMSNDNFLNGLYYSINRKVFAGNRGVNPSVNYFADSYLNDPENGKSYNDSKEHKAAVKGYEVYDKDGESLYGYSKDKAILSFKKAVQELVQSGAIIKGTKAKPTKITIHIKWMYQTDVKEYGEEIKKYFEDAFNDSRVSDNTVVLEVTQDAVTNWQDVYNEYLMKGQFDLGFGAISGNTYNPLNFLEVLKSDNSSGFTLNWGTDTSKVSTKKPLIYDDKMWSFDALWAAADHGGVVENGSIIKPVKKSFLRYLGNDFNNGATFYVTTNFFLHDSVKYEITRVSLYAVGSGNFDLPFTVDADGDYVITLSQAKAQEIVAEIMRVNKMDDKDKDNYNDHPLEIDNYGIYWTIEVYYNLSIKKDASGDEWGTPSESYVTAAKNEDAWKD